MKVRIHLDGSKTITGSAAECAEFLGLLDKQSEWPDGSVSLSDFDADGVKIQLPTEAPKVFKIPTRSVSATADELRDILAGRNVEGISGRDHYAALSFARKLRLSGEI